MTVEAADTLPMELDAAAQYARNAGFDRVRIAYGRVEVTRDPIAPAEPDAMEALDAAGFSLCGYRKGLVACYPPCRCAPSFRLWYEAAPARGGFELRRLDGERGYDPAAERRPLRFGFACVGSYTQTLLGVSMEFVVRGLGPYTAARLRAAVVRAGSLTVGDTQAPLARWAGLASLADGLTCLHTLGDAPRGVAVSLDLLPFRIPLDTRDLVPLAPVMLELQGGALAAAG